MIEFEYERKATYHFDPVRAKLILAPLAMPQCFQRSMNQYKLFKPPTLPPSMHQKPTNDGKSCMQNDQIPTKRHVE